MDPNYQQPGQPGGIPPTTSPAPQDPYHFIMNTEHQPKKSFGPNPGSFKGRLLFVAGGGLLLIIALIMAFSLLFGSRENNSQLLTSLTAEQQEIIRVSDLGVLGATDPATKAFAETTKLSVMTQQQSLTSYLASKKVKVTTVILASKKDATTDTALTSATANNRFDDVFTEMLKARLASYATALKRSYDSSSNQASKKILADSYNSTTQLLK
jgi:hypothetical protein